MRSRTLRMHRVVKRETKKVEHAGYSESRIFSWYNFVQPFVVNAGGCGSVSQLLN
jgi:hypothetical protein